MAGGSMVSNGGLILFDTHDPRCNAKLYVPKLTEEERRARATPLESLRRPRPRPADPEEAPSSPQRATAEIATAQRPTQEPVAQEAHTPNYVPAAWEVVFAQFPELYPDHADLALAAVAVPGEEHVPCSQALPGRSCAGARNVRPEAPPRKGLRVVEVSAGHGRVYRYPGRFNRGTENDELRRASMPPGQ